MFHARVHGALDAKAAAGELTPLAVRRRIHEIGEAAFDEIRTVLGQEDMLLPPRADESTYIEFVATYLELRRFAPSYLPRYFPDLQNLEAIDDLIRRDVDVETLFRATRPAGAPNPSDSCELDEWAGISTEEGLSAATAQGRRDSLRDQVSRVDAKVAASGGGGKCRSGGDLSRPRGAVRRRNCAGRVRTAVKMDVDHLIGRLQSALEVEQASSQPWQDSLFALVSQTPRGIWTVEARLFYDLQKVCVDHERDIYTVDVVEWALSWGERPVKRHLPGQRDVLMLKHLHSAVRRLAVVRISDEQRRQLALLVRDAIVRVEARIRQRLRPKIIAALDEVGLMAQNLPERGAQRSWSRNCWIRFAERGFLSVGDLRNAISRNNLKLPDIAAVLTFSTATPCFAPIQAGAGARRRVPPRRG